jgi:hypothetical protein
VTDLPSPLVDHVRGLVGQEWSDDEILDSLDRTWNSFGRLWPWGPGPPTPMAFGPMPLHTRGIMAAALAEVRGVPAAGPGTRPTGPETRPSGPNWQSIVTKYRIWMERPGNRDRRPDQAELATELHIGERTLVRWLRQRCGVPIADWRDVHALVLSEPSKD